MVDKRKEAEIALDKAAAEVVPSEAVEMRRESEIVSLGKDDIKDLLPAAERAKREAKAAEFERLWQERKNKNNNS